MFKVGDEVVYSDPKYYTHWCFYGHGRQLKVDEVGVVTSIRANGKVCVQFYGGRNNYPPQHLKLADIDYDKLLEQICQTS